MPRRRSLLAFGLALAMARAARAREPQAEARPAADLHADARERMLRAIDRDMQDTAIATGRDRLDPRVRAALARVPRHRFVPAAQAHAAYANRPLPIGHGQTISQPFVVALMTQLLEPKATDRVLEVGTGSGYQAAVLAELVAQVYTIEIVRPLGERAAETLRELGYGNVHTRIGDGYVGWPEAAPFDGIIVTAAPERMPQPLVDQLAPGGRLVAPIGQEGAVQQLVLLRKDADGRTVTRELLQVRFVPMTRAR